MECWAEKLRIFFCYRIDILILFALFASDCIGYYVYNQHGFKGYIYITLALRYDNFTAIRICFFVFDYIQVNNR